MWIVVLFHDQKISIEVSGEETPQDIKNILNEVYGFTQKLSFSFDNMPLPEKYNLCQLNEIPQIQGNEVVQMRVIIQDKSMKEFPNIAPSIRQESYIQMGLSTDIQTANSESNPSSTRSSRSSSKYKSILKASPQTKPAPQVTQPAPQNNQVNKKPQVQKQEKPAPINPVRPTQNFQTRPPQYTQPKPAPPPQTRPVQNQVTRPVQNQVTRPAQNIPARPANNAPTRPALNSAPSENVQNLMDLGFTQKQVEDALRSSNNNVEAAANLLLNNSGGSGNNNGGNNNGGNNNGGNTAVNNNVQQIMEMGFTKKQAEDALRSSNNNVEAAVNLLLQ